MSEVVTTPRGEVRAKTPACAGAGSAAAPLQGHPRDRAAAKIEHQGHHDDFTPRAFVVTVLKAVFRMNEEQANASGRPCPALLSDGYSQRRTRAL
jgi:hypothetical protein